MQSVLIATPQQDAVDSIRTCLEGRFHLETVKSREQILTAPATRKYRAVFMDLDLIMDQLPAEEQQNYRALLRPFRSAFPDTPIIILSLKDKVRKTVGLVKAGADDYLVLPIEPNEVSLVLESIFQQRKIESELAYLRESSWKAEARQFVRTRSLLMKGVYEKVESVAATRATVLLGGETGTGKSRMAKLIHMQSNRAEGPLVSVHCGSMPDNLVESELFGHERGAFTGAERRKLGKFQIADKGTIFLDEVGTISANAQIKLLQVLQDGAFSRVGGEETIKVDVRVVAATNVDLKMRCDKGEFRSDLYYRLNVFAVDLPPLRQRLEDIPLLADAFLDKLNREYGKDLLQIDDEVLEAFQAYSWPGNIREMENLMERAYILEKNNTLSKSGLPVDLLSLGPMSQNNGGGYQYSLADVRQTALEDVEQRYLVKLLTQKKGRIEQCAQQAGITTRQLHNLMAKYALRSKDFR